MNNLVDKLLIKCFEYFKLFLFCSSMAAKVEMGQQDMDAIVAMERSQDQEKETVSRHFVCE